ncbi:non-hydrolyzing UDP-N-acetylglucosamine 2-epimerase [Rufibacter latericius]|uniref:UDP-N-acetylglucosamine 2-epimerase (non-hydrolyzing) n=1 Tax=Rufibacter latericius TaxID=2487040 RepID=A0A3M9MA56_9BACT|nr:UDP-N-acetylglucosamine 2-epimerase (non-hydrolyzing) [Rufibacter latericius]RNI22451.1 UDP-N-acetylglucosamine 2-epimerase (non-hydrolyzing) [Rufibacter latericius]
MKKILFVFGTRPEAIKMAPLIKEFSLFPGLYQTVTCITGQHRQMLDQVLEFFSITPDYDMNLMRADQSLFDITSNGLKALEAVLEDCAPSLVFVQGDTTTAFIGALACYYKKIKVAHLEAGLRSGNRLSPFPEEGNRLMIGHLADFHFPPTSTAQQNLARENIRQNVFVVGNTVIDALHLGLQIIQEKEEPYRAYFQQLDLSKKIILVTGHRRESFGEPFENICSAIKEIAQTFEEVEIVYPVHLNPNVQEVVNRQLNGYANIHLLAPLEYPHLLWLMSKCYLVLTDSGGIQEEAPSLGKPVLVMRDITERMEGIEAGTAVLVGTHKATIVQKITDLLTDEPLYQSMATAVNPYGDGTTSKQIVSLFQDLPL